MEDEGTLELLEAMHCDKAQGHLFGAAVRARELEALVDKWNSRFPVKSRSSAAG